MVRLQVAGGFWNRSKGLNIHNSPDIMYSMGRQEGQRERPSNYYDPHHLFMVSTLKKKKKSLYYFMNKSHCKLHQKKKERERKGEF